ncbi:MAG TPA: helix-turn-helix domain-containing protein, partial [Burkholderiales bacterium]|nr:helix-turn-helix domain-containing protein [Burkholderiales bacterium]
DDIGLLANAILERLASQAGTLPARLTAPALERLAQYDFPGNIRELENILERALALTSSHEIGLDDLRLASPAAPGGTPTPGGAEALPDYLDAIERKAIVEALGKTGFNRTAAAKLLGITFRQLRYRMQRLGIKDEAKS